MPSETPPKPNQLILAVLLTVLIGPPVVASWIYDWSRLHNYIGAGLWAVFVLGALLLFKRLKRK